MASLKQSHKQSIKLALISDVLSITLVIPTRPTVYEFGVLLMSMKRW